MKKAIIAFALTMIQTHSVYGAQKSSFRVNVADLHCALTVQIVTSEGPDKGDVVRQVTEFDLGKTADSWVGPYAATALKVGNEIFTVGFAAPPISAEVVALRPELKHETVKTRIVKDKDGTEVEEINAISKEKLVAATLVFQGPDASDSVIFRDSTTKKLSNGDFSTKEIGTMVVCSLNKKDITDLDGTRVAPWRQRRPATSK